MSKALIHKEELVSWLLRGAQAGSSLEDCGSMVGVSGGTIGAWLRRGKEAIAISQESEVDVPEEEFAYAKFAADFEQAQSIGRVYVLEDLRDHHDWRAKVQWLARTSDQYKDVDKKQIEITGAGGGPIDIGLLVSGAVAQLDAADQAAELARVEEFRRLEQDTAANMIIEGQLSMRKVNE